MGFFAEKRRLTLPELAELAELPSDASVEQVNAAYVEAFAERLDMEGHTPEQIFLETKQMANQAAQEYIDEGGLLNTIFGRYIQMRVRYGKHAEVKGGTSLRLGDSSTIRPGSRVDITVRFAEKIKPSRVVRGTVKTPRFSR